MEYLKQLIDWVLHLDKHLGEVIRDYGTWTYLILFAIVFCETGLVVTPFLPGDSLLFAAGTLASSDETGGVINVHLLVFLLIVAAVVGDTVNYHVGYYVGPKVFTGKSRFLKKEHLDRAHAFYEKYGAKAIVLARFVPIVRTFVPFVAGIGKMSYTTFITYNVIGGVVWVALLTYAGYLFGGHPVVKKNFSLVILAIIVISILPMVIEFLRAKYGKHGTTLPAPADMENGKDK